MIDYRPLWSSRKIVFERFNAARWSFGECFNTSVSTVPYVADNLMSRCCSLRKEPVPNPLDFTFYKKPSRYALHVRSAYLHLNNSPSFPFSNVNVSTSESESLRLSVIVLPLIDPV